jgi:hypothetical protein
MFISNQMYWNVICSLISFLKEEKYTHEITMLYVLPFQLLNQLTDFHKDHMNIVLLEATLKSHISVSYSCWKYELGSWK